MSSFILFLMSQELFGEDSEKAWDAVEGTIAGELAAIYQVIIHPPPSADAEDIGFLKVDEHHKIGRSGLDFCKFCAQLFVFYWLRASRC